MRCFGNSFSRLSKGPCFTGVYKGAVEEEDEAEEEVVEEEDEEDVEEDAADELDDGSVEAPEAEEVDGEEEASVADPSLEEVVDPSDDWVVVLGLDGAKEHDVNSNAKNNGTPFPNLAWGFLGMMDLH